MKRAWCGCSFHERKRFAAWRKKAEALAKTVERARRIGDLARHTAQPDVDRAAGRLYRAIFERLQGAEPDGMAREIVSACANIANGDYESAVVDLQGLEESEAENQEINPDERRCPQAPAKAPKASKGGGLFA